MTPYRISDADIQDVKNTTYDLALFSSGYELRSSHVSQLIHRDKVRRVSVLGFAELQDAEARLANDRLFERQWAKPTPISGNDDQAIYEILQDQLATVGTDDLTILVDYSSMSRVWYASGLNWARYADRFAKIRVDLTYSVGEHKDPVPPMVISDILSLPGCEGSSTPLFRSVALFGLGFDGWASLCVLDRLEPDTVYAFLASPAPFKDYPNQARFSNQELIERYAKETFGLPLDSVEQTFRQLTEIVSPHRREADITAVPMGPKPHVLAAILLAIRFEEVGCLRVSGHRTAYESIAATGQEVATLVDGRRASKNVAGAVPTAAM